MILCWPVAVGGETRRLRGWKRMDDGGRGCNVEGQAKTSESMDARREEDEMEEKTT